jgi:hypothetical protein
VGSPADAITPRPSSSGVAGMVTGSAADTRGPGLRVSPTDAVADALRAVPVVGEPVADALQDLGRQGAADNRLLATPDAELSPEELERKHEAMTNVALALTGEPIANAAGKVAGKVAGAVTSKAGGGGARPLGPGRLGGPRLRGRRPGVTAAQSRTAPTPRCRRRCRRA